MTRNIFNNFLVILSIILIICVYIRLANPPNNNDGLMQKITEIELKVDSLNNKKDSIRVAIDSTHVKIITNEKHYQERINTILTQPASADSSYVSNYIRFHRSKRDSINIQ